MDQQVRLRILGEIPDEVEGHVVRCRWPGMQEDDDTEGQSMGGSSPNDDTDGSWVRVKLEPGLGQAEISRIDDPGDDAEGHARFRIYLDVDRDERGEYVGRFRRTEADDEVQGHTRP